MDHDQHFKALIREFFASFLQLFFADWLDLIDLTDLEWLEQEVFPDPPEGSRHLLDMVVRARSLEPIPPWHDRAGSAFLMAILIEIESPDNTTSIWERMPRYVRHLRDKLQMPVLPIALFLKVGLDGVGTLVHEERIRNLLVERSEFLYVGLPHFDAVQYVEGENWLGVALSALMRIPRDRAVWLGAEALRRLSLAPLTDQQKFLLGNCVEKYLPLTDDEQRQLAGMMPTETTLGIKPVNVTSYDRGLKEGEQLGFQKGEQLGLQKGVLKGKLENALEFRFGDAGLALMERLRGIEDIVVLESMLARLRAAKTLEEFEREIR
ncbi:RpnC/YadD family protein [Zavarzinella formosa]|uniref:hypothetical protein n=1 Tax=Zavarzinella formosa TaxID=360055 RepID=UPI0002DDFBBF|nr:hypothetical protein [Zavarzinella formosa]